MAGPVRMFDVAGYEDEAKKMNDKHLMAPLQDFMCVQSGQS